MNHLRMPADPKVNELKDIRGMSEPFYFSFSVPVKGLLDYVVAHAVIFTTFEIASNDEQLKMCQLESDPRMREFVQYVIENYGQKAKEALAQELRTRVDELDALERKLIELRHQINRTKKELK